MKTFNIQVLKKILIELNEIDFPYKGDSFMGKNTMLNGYFSVCVALKFLKVIIFYI